MAEPLAQIGLIADIQHADIDDGVSAYGKVRHYRDSLQKARLAAQDWAARCCTFAVNLGDTVDRRAGDGASAALLNVLANLQPYSRLIHILGNHDLSSLSAADLSRLEGPFPEDLTILDGGGRYHDIYAADGWQLVVLDTYDICVTRCPDKARRLRKALLVDYERRGISSLHLSEHEELNGAIGPEQLQWLSHRLQEARVARRRVVLLSHSSLRPEPTYYGDAVCWNWHEVDELLEGYSDVVAAVIAGHDHFGRTFKSHAGVHHCVLEAAMEGDLGVPTHAVLELYGTGLALRGRGAVTSWERHFHAE